MPKVLIVDDEEILLRVMARIVRGLDGEWFVATATNAADAVKLLDTEPFDLVVTDWQPYGQEVTDAAWARSIPVVVVTGTPGVAAAYIKDRAPIVTKPFAREVLEDTVRAACAHTEVTQCQ